MRRTLSSFDHAISAWLHERPRSLRYFYGWVTLIGHPAVIVFLAIAGITFSFGIGLNSIGQGFIAALIAYGVSALLKLLLRRARPSTPYAAGMHHTSFSFPSGHAVGSMIVYGIFAYVAAKYLTSEWALLAVSGLSAVIFLIGVSRIYLGAHYVLDVLGGWIFSACALYWIFAIIG